MADGAAAAPPAKVYYDGCPGCAMDRKKESRRGIPYKELLFVAILTLASGTVRLYTYIPDCVSYVHTCT
jgi:hypothetical protein